MLKMNVSLIALALAVSAKSNEVAAKHPVREELVEEIKLKTTSWTPRAVEDNHMRHKSVESLYHSMGHLGTQRTSKSTELFREVTHGAYEMFRQITSAALGKKYDNLQSKQTKLTDSS